MSFVLDIAVVSAWLIDSQSTAYSATIAERLQEDRAVAPPLLALEFTNVLRTACKRQGIVAAQAQEALSLLARLPVDIDAEKPDPPKILDLALRYDLTSYDAAYLDLALRRRLPIASQDTALAAAARIAGVGVVVA